MRPVVSVFAVAAVFLGSVDPAVSLESLVSAESAQIPGIDAKFPAGYLWTLYFSSVGFAGSLPNRLSAEVAGSAGSAVFLVAEIVSER